MNLLLARGDFSVCNLVMILRLSVSMPATIGNQYFLNILQSGKCRESLFSGRTRMLGPGKKLRKFRPVRNYKF